MIPFSFIRVQKQSDVFEDHGGKIKFLAGGTTIVDLMKLEVESTKFLLDINKLPYNEIEKIDSGLRIGAIVRNADLAFNPIVQKEYRVLSDALLSGASPQLRNKATTGGNLLQRTRCVYFRDVTKACNKRMPGSGCAAIDGFNRNLAIMGTSEHCIATNPSDMNVALAALDAKIHMKNKKKERIVNIQDFHLLPGNTPHKETVLEDGELITHVTIPKLATGSVSGYLKLRDRASYEFALASIAVVLKKNGDRIESIRFAMGGIGVKPWRVPAVEKMLEGALPTDENLRAAANEFLKGAKAHTENGFKINLARLCFMEGIKQTFGRA